VLVSAFTHRAINNVLNELAEMGLEDFQLPTILSGR